MPEFGQLQIVDLRKIWPHEALNFTPWLAENLDALGACLGMELELTESEADVGDFSLDILAKDLGTGRNVIVENQLTATDHDHLGKLLTYAAGFDATAVVWVAQSIRDEHRQALQWLNQRTNEETHFFAVVVEVLQIDGSKPAFQFKPVVFPNEWVRSVPTTKTNSTRSEAYRLFFQSLIDELRERHRFTNAKVGQPQNWYSFSSGVTGISFAASFAQGAKVRVEIYVDVGDTSQNKAIFGKLYDRRSEIEAAFGESLEWERLDERRASRIASYFPGSIEASTEELSAIRAGMIDRLLRFRKAISSAMLKSVCESVMVTLPASAALTALE